MSNQPLEQMIEQFKLTDWKKDLEERYCSENALIEVTLDDLEILGIPETTSKQLLTELDKKYPQRKMQRSKSQHVVSSLFFSTEDKYN